jgi:hypothetical protein
VSTDRVQSGGALLRSVYAAAVSGGGPAITIECGAGTGHIGAGARAALRTLRTGQRAAEPGCDAIAFDGGPLGPTLCRLTELHPTWFPQEGHADLVMAGTGR